MHTIFLLHGKRYHATVAHYGTAIIDTVLLLFLHFPKCLFVWAPERIDASHGECNATLLGFMFQRFKSATTTNCLINGVFVTVSNKIPTVCDDNKLAPQISYSQKQLPTTIHIDRVAIHVIIAYATTLWWLHWSMTLRSWTSGWTLIATQSKNAYATAVY